MTEGLKFICAETGGVKGGKRQTAVFGRLRRECVSKQVLSALPRRPGAGVVKETFDIREGLNCLLSSALALTRAQRETSCISFKI